MSDGTHSAKGTVSQIVLRVKMEKQEVVYFDHLSALAEVDMFHLPRTTTTTTTTSFINLA